jgi:hypothetical protein
MLRSCGMIAMESATGAATAQLVITICNYDRYQLPIAAGATGDPVAALQRRDSDATDYNNITNEQETLRVSAPRRRSAHRGSRLSQEWQPQANEVLFAEQYGLDAEATALRFRDYWLGVPDPKGRKTDWSATWRNWCRTEAKAKGGERGARRPVSIISALRTAASAGPLQERPGNIITAAHAALAAGPLRSSEQSPPATQGRSDQEWRDILRRYEEDGATSSRWDRDLGLPPTHIATRVPRRLLKEFGFQ